MGDGVESYEGRVGISPDGVGQSWIVIHSASRALAMFGVMPVLCVYPGPAVFSAPAD